MEEPELALQLQMLTVLALLLHQDVVRRFAAVCNEIRRTAGDIAEKLLVYFKDTYIGRFRLDAPRGNPMFNRALEHAPSD